MTNSADPDQLASEEANWSGSTLFVKAGYILVQQEKGLFISMTEVNICVSLSVQIHFWISMVLTVILPGIHFLLNMESALHNMGCCEYEAKRISEAESQG